MFDRLQPIILNYCAKGKTWKEANVKSSDILEVNQIIGDGSEQLWKFAKELISKAIEKKYLPE